MKWSCHVLATPIKLHRAASSLRNAGGLIRLSSTVLARLHRSATSSPKSRHGRRKFMNPETPQQSKPDVRGVTTRWLLLGVCGAGMRAFAEILLDAGQNVTGTDIDERGMRSLHDHYGQRCQLLQQQGCLLLLPTKSQEAPSVGRAGAASHLVLQGLGLLPHPEEQGVLLSRLSVRQRSHRTEEEGVGARPQSSSRPARVQLWPNRSTNATTVGKCGP